MDPATQLPSSTPPSNIFAAPYFSPLQTGLLDAFAAACDSLPADLRHAAILIGGAATIAHGINSRYTKDVDILVSTEALVILKAMVGDCRAGFHEDADGKIKYNAEGPPGKSPFQVEVEFVELGGPFVPRIPSVVGFRGGSLATIPELVRLRAETLVSRGDKQDYLDLRLLLLQMRCDRLKLPHVERSELEILLEAAEMLDEETEGGRRVDARDYRRILYRILSSFTCMGVVVSVAI